MTDAVQAEESGLSQGAAAEPAAGAPIADREQPGAAESWSEPEEYVRVLSALASGEGAQAIARLEQLQAQPPLALPELAATYLSGMATLRRARLGRCRRATCVSMSSTAPPTTGTCPGPISASGRRSRN